ncbi:reverse transcriptase domain-containing protein [Tanacetum coccineum]
MSHLRGKEDSIFMEIPKPKAKKTVNLVILILINAECSAIIMNKVPEKLEDPGKFLIPCALQELDRTSALADSGASINLLPHSIYKKLGLEALSLLRLTIELANLAVHYSFDDPSPSSSPVKTSDNFVKFADELAPLNSLPPGNDDSTLKKDLHEENFQEDVEIKNSNVSDKLDYDQDSEILRGLYPFDILVLCCMGYGKYQTPEISQKRTRERMSDQEAKEIKSRSQRDHASAFYSQLQLNPQSTKANSIVL